MGNKRMKDLTNAEIIIHEREAQSLINQSPGMMSSFGADPSPPADRTVKEGDEIVIGETYLKVLHTPGHSPGSISLYHTGIVFTGDTLFVGGRGPDGPRRRLVGDPRAIGPQQALYPCLTTRSSRQGTITAKRRRAPSGVRRYITRMSASGSPVKNLVCLFLVLGLAAFLFSCQSVPVAGTVKAKTGTPKIALVLGGGAAKGFAHVGVIRVLEQEKIPIHMVVGTSVGSLIGAIYASNPDSFQLEWTAFRIDRNDILDISLVNSKWGPVQGTKLEAFVDQTVKAKKVEDTKIPFYPVANRHPYR